MRQMIAIMPNPAFFKDTQGIYQGTNAAFEKLLGLSQKEIVGKAIGDVAPEEIVAQHQEHDQALLANPGHQIYEAPLEAWDGVHHVIFIKSTYQRPDGTIGGIIGILKDMTQRLRAEEELEQLRKFSDSTVQTMTEGLVLTDSESQFTFVNPAAARMLGYTPSEMVDRDVLSFIPKDQHAIVRREDEKRAKGISDRYELVFLHKDGSRRTFLVSGGPRVQGAQFGGTLAVLTDITDRKAMEEEIKALSLRDELTTLYNRRGFLTLAEQQLKTANRLKKKLALLYLDMDNLKRINDAGGHKMGDRALEEIAFILKKSFREADIVGRLGGDEFCVLAMETNRPLDVGRPGQEAPGEARALQRPLVGRGRLHPVGQRRRLHPRAGRSGGHRGDAEPGRHAHVRREAGQKGRRGGQAARALEMSRPPAPSRPCHGRPFVLIS